MQTTRASCLSLVSALPGSASFYAVTCCFFVFVFVCLVAFFLFFLLKTITSFSFLFFQIGFQTGD